MREYKVNDLVRLEETPYIIRSILHENRTRGTVSGDIVVTYYGLERIYDGRHIILQHKEIGEHITARPFHLPSIHMPYNWNHCLPVEICLIRWKTILEEETTIILPLKVWQEIVRDAKDGQYDGWTTISDSEIGYAAIEEAISEKYHISANRHPCDYDAPRLVISFTPDTVKQAKEYTFSEDNNNDPIECTVLFNLSRWDKEETYSQVYVPLDDLQWFFLGIAILRQNANTLTKGDALPGRVEASLDGITQAWDADNECVDETDRKVSWFINNNIVEQIKERTKSWNVPDNFLHGQQH